MSVNKNGQETTHGLYGSGVEQDRDKGGDATASLYTNLTPEQEQKLDKALSKPQEYETFTNNCSHYAKNVYEETTGKELSNKAVVKDAEGRSHNGSCPAGLENSIRSREIDPKTETRTVSDGQQQKATPDRQQQPPDQGSPNRQGPENTQPGGSGLKKQEQQPNQQQGQPSQQNNSPEKLEFKRDTPRDQEKGPPQDKAKSDEKAQNKEQLSFKKDTNISQTKGR